ncbi:MAG TPA: class I SAM-dependent methyltransferase [Methylomirabilota bacterium]|nr:class I SAM-dependent methyltransferase [Methylomirabilota bacterium]
MTPDRVLTGVVAPDGSPVDIYRALPRPDEADLIHAAIPAGASMLDLGCGTGRFARALAALGHEVVAVDHEPAMLEGLDDIDGITAIVGDIRSLSLGRTFDAVLLASHLVNDDELGPRVLSVARDHLAPAGVVIGEVYAAGTDWPAAVGRRSQRGPVGITVTRAAVDGDRLSASVRYDLEGRTWDQPFTARLLDEQALARRLDDAGLALDGWLDARSAWFRARLGPD